MSEPKIADFYPKMLELNAGTYSWCACGRSASQPFCDGSHTGTEFRPVPFELEEPKKVAMCMCKLSGRKPFCDGSHQEL
jgi:CDGSH-type Zn-finger protein